MGPSEEHHSVIQEQNRDEALFAINFKRIKDCEVIFEKNLSGARPIEASLGKRQDSLLGIEFDLHQLLLLQKF